jgi:hypothetical protein
MRVHTGFSFKSATGHLNEVQGRLKAIGWPVLPIADRCSTYAWAAWAKAATAAGLPAIYGVELAVVPNHYGTTPPIDHWTFYAKADVRVLHNLVAIATQRIIGAEPCLTYAEALAAKGCVKIAGERCQLAQVQKKFYAKGKDLYLALSPALPRGLVQCSQGEAGNSWPPATTPTPMPIPQIYRVAMASGPPCNLPTNTRTRRAACAWFVDHATMQAALRNRAALIARPSCQSNLLQPAANRTRPCG